MSNFIKDSNDQILKSIGDNNHIENVFFVGNDIVIGNNCTIRDSIISGGVYITDSYIESAEIGRCTRIGPYSRIRPGTRMGCNCKVGNFVEIKNSILGDDVKVSHLTYIGDACISNRVNIGCGVVFANYDGIKKHTSYVGDDCFIGSNVNIIAPVKIKSGSFICAGTTVTRDTEVGDFVIGRARAESKRKYFNYLKNKRKD